MCAALSGCNQIEVHTVCPKLKSYSPEQLRKVAETYPGLNTETRMLLRDYGQVREICRRIGG